ncbi:unnamed protein product [Brassicogethes aeneus]|uniref:Uncharacterized protein n=1 Tax=Brassicogethes aeneus TaxID=1431903 RepID=A0A9P0BDT6_BRAAE|nr:unnamed protein product [Brassicogethes aeneus]
MEIQVSCELNLWKEKIEIEDNNAEDSLSYTQYDIYHFNQEKSGSLRDTDYVTILHPLIVGIANTVERDSPALLNVVNKAIPPIFNDPTTMYLTVRVKDILFDGVKVYCTNKDFTSKAVCTQLKTQIPGIKSSNEKNVYLFSLLGPRNGTHQKRFKVLKGIKHSKDLGRLLELDSQNELKIWGTPQCNRFKGTDGWIFPPGLDKEEGVWSFSADLCR